MKTTLALIAALAASSVAANAKIVQLDDVSADVRATIEANVPDNKLADISINLVADGDRYVVKLNLKNGNKLRLDISAEGELLKSKKDINLNAIPDKVRDAVDEILTDLDEIVEVERVKKDGEVIYHIHVETGDNDETEILVSKNGIILKSEQDIEFKELSQKLKKAVNKLLKKVYVVDDIDRVIKDGKVTYHVELESTLTGKTVKVVFNNNGILIDGDL